LELRVRNDDGEGLVTPAATVMVVYRPKKKPQPPRAELIAPLGNTVAATPRAEFAFRVVGTGKLQVSVRHNDKALPPGAPVAEGPGRVYRLRVDLQPGNNTLQATVAGEDGTAQTPAVVVNYVPPWNVHVHATHLERREPGKKAKVIALTGEAPV